MNFVWRQLGLAFFGATASVVALFVFFKIADGLKRESENGMKKIILLLTIIVVLSACLVSCVGQNRHIHEFDEWSVTKNATCTEDGVKSRYCSCGEKQSENIPATGHKEQILQAQEATCTEKGLTEGKKCTECGEIFVLQAEIPEAEHNYVNEKDATCEVCGYVREVDCDHTSVTILEAESVTCLKDGLTEGKMCTICETIIQPQTVITAQGHNISDWIIEKEPTESEDGYKYKKCSTCGEKVEEVVIPFVANTSLEYSINTDEKTCTITGIGTFDGTKLDIPEYVGKYKVTAIGEKAFSECTGLTEINIPETVKTIGTRAFYGCTGITEITIPESVTSIGTQIFFKAENLITVYYNSSYDSDDNNFMNLSHIKNVVFGGKKVPSDILNGCAAVLEVEIKDSVTSIGIGAFSGCTSLESITIPDSVTSIGAYAFRECTSLTSITIPDSVTSIGDGAFYDSSALTSVTIPDSVTRIGGSAFYGCDSLTSVTIPDSVTSIGNWAFSDCTSLESITIPDSVTQIGNEAFRGCKSLTSIIIPDSVTQIGNEAFRGCKSLTSITIPDSVTSIGGSAFSGCTSLTIYCEATSEPSGWNSIWNYSNIPVVWGYTGE